MQRNLIRDEMNGLVRVGRWIAVIGGGILVFIFVMSFQGCTNPPKTAQPKFENRHYGGYAAMQAAQKAQQPKLKVRHE